MNPLNCHWYSSSLFWVKFKYFYMAGASRTNQINFRAKMINKLQSPEAENTLWVEHKQKYEAHLIILAYNIEDRVTWYVHYVFCA